MKVLVTGGAGYIGSHMVDLLIENNYEVVVFDNLYTGHRAAVHQEATFVLGDLLNTTDVRQLFNDHQFEGIFHFASHTLVGESMQKPWLYLRENLLAASHLLEAATQHNVKRFVLSSTANLFDEPETMPIKETNRIVPGSPYGESKAMIERMLHWMDVIYGLKSCCLRYFNASGAHPDGHIGEDHTPETHLIPIVLEVALGKRDQITMYGDSYNTADGTCVRDYIHVLDLATAHLAAFDTLSEGQSVRYNLGNGKGYSVKEVVEVARRVTQEAIPAIVGPIRPGDPAILVADSSAFSKKTGWYPEFNSLEAILQTAWSWHKNNPNGYDDR